MLHWNWEEKIGEMKVNSGHTINLYQGNALLIMIQENEEDNTFQLYGFFGDKSHMRNCLGLNKKGGYDRNIYEGIITDITINKKKYSYTADLVSAMTKAFDNLTIHLVSEWKEDNTDA